MWLSICVVVAAAPSFLDAQGICESFCAECMSNEIVMCAGLDGCQASLGECYFRTDTECTDCPPD